MYGEVARLVNRRDIGLGSTMNGDYLCSISLLILASLSASSRLNWPRFPYKTWQNNIIYVHTPRPIWLNPVNDTGKIASNHIPVHHILQLHQLKQHFTHGIFTSVSKINTLLIIFLHWKQPKIAPQGMDACFFSQRLHVPSPENRHNIVYGFRRGTKEKYTRSLEKHNPLTGPFQPWPSDYQWNWW